MDSYIIYKGGQFGDLVFSILNNGVHLPAWVQHKLKNDEVVNDKNFKNFIYQLPTKIITGCVSYPLDWGATNYELVCTDNALSAFSVTRLVRLNANVDLKNIIKSYYTDKVKEFANNLTEEQILDLLIKKYQTHIINPKVSDSNIIDINCIYDKEKFINSLARRFEFNVALARLQYDQWYERELPLLDKFFKTV